MTMTMRSKPTFALGIGLVVLSIVLYRQLEIQSFNSTNDFQFAFLKYTWFPTLASGVVVTLIGSVLFFRRADAGEMITAGAIGVGFPLAIIGFTTNFINVHDWTGILILVLPLSVIVGLVFLLVGFIRLGTPGGGRT